MVPRTIIRVKAKKAFKSVLAAMALVALLSPGQAARAEEAAPASLKATLIEADGLAKTPEGVPEAIAQYQSIIEIHEANEEVFGKALRHLWASYEKSGRAEEGIRFFIDLVEAHLQDGRGAPYMAMFEEIRLGHPELVQGVVQQLSGSAKASLPTAEPWAVIKRAVLQRKNEALRTKGLERIAAGLEADAPVGTKRPALATLRDVLSAKFDRKPLRERVLPLLASEDAGIRRDALRCLPGLNAGPADLAQVAPLADDPEVPVRKCVGRALIQAGQGKYDEEVIPALMQLLADEEPEVVEQTIRSMWGQYSSPEFDERLIELAANPKYHHNVVYFGLSTMRSKSVAVCAYLVKELANPDWNNSGRAAWGLTYGVADEAKALVEEGLLAALPDEANAYTREQEFRALGDVASERARPYLESVAQSNMETNEFRAMARKILEDLENSK